ncbi:ATP-binding cassette domain-containing protein [Arthrobacter rhombi]|uniref:Putative ABC transporter ATP-binding protein n=1 Tax=Arthrobacter rhombi TaxID=71253 RepID=A0A1R4FER6_9MICC|nr:putative ABC transporter ATP-binding protein [Arthrobacter rhombi]
MTDAAATASRANAVAATANTGELAIETSRLSKSFGRRHAVDNLDLAVPHGSVFGFLGPNGSGKTTTIRMLLGLANPSSGTINVLGRPMPTASKDVLPRVGALVEGPAFYPFLSGRANLLRLDAANPRADARDRRRRVDRALETVGLSQASGLAVHAYSLGMKQRLGIANALATDHELLVLDEPTNGLDPQGTREVRHLIASMAGAGTTVFISSHLLSEIEQMCTHAAVMSAGHRVAHGTLEELRSDGNAYAVLETPDEYAARAVLARLGLGDLETREATASATEIGTEAGTAVVRVAVPEGAATAEEIVAALVAAGVRVRGFAIERPSLEERFVALTGEGFDLAQ